MTPDGRFYLGVPPDSDIKRLEDLRGKRVALFKGTNLHLAALRAWPTRASRSATSSSSTWTWRQERTALISRDVDAVFDYVGLFELRDRGLAKVVWSAAQKFLQVHAPDGLARGRRLRPATARRGTAGRDRDREGDTSLFG